MFPLSKPWIIVASVGHAMLFSLALSGAARIISGLLGAPLSPEATNNIFLVSTLVLGPPAGYFQLARLMLPAALQQPR